MTKTSRSQEWPGNDAFPRIEGIVASDGEPYVRRSKRRKLQNSRQSTRDEDIEQTETGSSASRDPSDADNTEDDREDDEESLSDSEADSDSPDGMRLNISKLYKPHELRRDWINIRNFVPSSLTFHPF